MSLGDEVALNPQPLPPEPDPDPVHRAVAFDRAVLGRDVLVPLRSRIVAAGTNVDLQATSADLRLGAASRFISAVGADNFARLAHLFQFGPITFTVQALVAMPGEPGQFASNRAVGHMVSIEIDDDATTCRRHYVLDQVPIGVRMPVTCALADGWVWSNDIQVACTPDHWDGQVLVNPALTVHRRFDAAVHDGSAAIAHDASVFGAESDRAQVISLDQRLTTVRQLSGLASASTSTSTSTSASASASASQRIDGALLGATRATRAATLDDAVVHADTGRRIDVLLTRHDPTGHGTTSGVNFTVSQFTPTVIH
jgi:hypothetical protein